MSYVYYAAGNIQTVSKSGTVYDQYAYDELGQLIREDNKDTNKSYTYTYDSRGNLLSKKTYAFTLGTLGTAQKTDSYGYATDSWKDRLTSYNGQTITYDSIGNPLTYNNGSAYTFTWEGRQMQTATKGSTTWTYTYNSDGLRTGKTNGTTTYTYTWNDGKLTSQTWGNSYMLFYYNAEGKPLYVEYHDANDECSGTYYYVLNLQGDTVALYDPARNITAVNYEYDAWGKEISWSTYDSGYAGLIFNNPLTYRGYIYDRETGFYYLQSRYYDPTIGRFLNADDVLYLGSTGSLISYTLFAYCDNNCVCSLDYDGHEKMAIFYDNRPSGLFGWILKGFRIQAQHWIEYFESRTQLSVFPFTSIDEFVKKWNLSDRKYDTVIIISHGFPGGLSCNGKNLVHVTNGYEKNSVFSYKLTSKSVKFLYLFCCNGATENASKMSIAKDLAFRTSALVFAVQNGKISIDLFSGAVTKAGGFWVRISYLGRGRNGDLWSIKEYLTLKSFSPSTI